MVEGSKEQEVYNQLKEKGLEQKYGKPGIYSISIGDQLAYIGKSKNMLERIANHLVQIETNSKSNKYRVLGQAIAAGRKINFDVMYYSPLLLEQEIEEDIGNKEGELIRQYLPPLNYQIPKKENFRKYECNKKAMTITLQEITEK